MRVNYSIIFFSDMKQAVAFYHDVMGLPLKFETPGWTEFATEGAARCTAAKAAAGAGRAGACRISMNTAAR